MARHALFPETIIESDFQAAVDGESDSMSDETMGGTEDDLDALLATLEGWNPSDSSKGQSSETATKSNNDSSSSLEERLTDELQAWRTHHVEQHYDDWAQEKKQEFMVSAIFLETIYAYKLHQLIKIESKRAIKNI